MDHTPYVIFDLHNARYALDVRVVEEILLLPELTPLAEVPPYVVGALNLRGTLVPVLDIELCLGGTPQAYQLTDNVLILRVETRQIGVIATQVYEPQRISFEEADPIPLHRRRAESLPALLRGVANPDGNSTLLLDPWSLIQYSEPALELVVGQDPETFAAGSKHVPGNAARRVEGRYSGPEASLEQRAVFRDRACRLKRSIESPNAIASVPLVVFRLNNEYFGADPRTVREISEVLPITPVPCCPSHIAGLMNLRGEIVTLVDIRKALKMPVADPRTAVKVMVVQVDNHLAGVLSDEVYEILYLHPSDLQGAPVVQNSADQEYIRGTALFGDKKLTVLDLPKILSTRELAVNEDL